MIYLFIFSTVNRTDNMLICQNTAVKTELEEEREKCCETERILTERISSLEAQTKTLQKARDQHKATVQQKMVSVEGRAHFINVSIELRHFRWLLTRGGTIHWHIDNRYIAIPFPRYVSRYSFFLSQFFFFLICFNFFLLYNDFHLGRRYLIISSCNFCKAIPHNYT